MISEHNFRVETPYGVKIFQKFHFQKHAPNILKTLAKKNFKNLNVELTGEFIFWYLKVEYVISEMSLSPHIITTETKLYISDFYER